MFQTPLIMYPPMILDIHTHSLTPDPEAIIDISGLLKEEGIEKTIEYIESSQSQGGQLFSVGVHPWWMAEGVGDEVLDGIRELAHRDEIAAIGEVGIDIPKGGLLFRQMKVFREMIELSEEVEKPLLIHNVKGQEIIIELHKDMRPAQRWAIHGMRSKPGVAAMFLREGLYLSFGEYFNEETLRSVPMDYILAETDESDCSIRKVISSLAGALSLSDEALQSQIGANASRFLGR